MAIVVERRRHDRRQGDAREHGERGQQHPDEAEPLHARHQRHELARRGDGPAPSARRGQAGDGAQSNSMYSGSCGRVPRPAWGRAGRCGSARRRSAMTTRITSTGMVVVSAAVWSSSRTGPAKGPSSGRIAAEQRCPSRSHRPPDRAARGVLTGGRVAPPVWPTTSMRSTAASPGLGSAGGGGTAVRPGAARRRSPSSASRSCAVMAERLPARSTARTSKRTVRSGHPTGQRAGARRPRPAVEGALRRGAAPRWLKRQVHAVRSGVCRSTGAAGATVSST